MARRKKKQLKVLHLKKGYNTLWAVDKSTQEIMESIELNDERYYTMTELTKEDLRSAAQNRLLWMMYTDMEKTTVNEWAGRTQKDWHIEMKKRFLSPIYERDDPRYSLTIASLRGMYSAGLKEQSVSMFDWIVDEKISTTDASIKQFAEYLTKIHLFCGEFGIWLRIDREIWDLAMNGEN